MLSINWHPRSKSGYIVMQQPVNQITNSLWKPFPRIYGIICLITGVYFPQVKNKPWIPWVYTWIWHCREHIFSPFTSLSLFSFFPNTTNICTLFYLSPPTFLPVVFYTYLNLVIWHSYLTYLPYLYSTLFSLLFAYSPSILISSFLPFIVMLLISSYVLILHSNLILFTSPLI
jgi:hypothetical protein